MDDSYIDDIDYHGENVLVIIEGLTMYLCEKDIRKMFFIIEKSFQEVTVMVETMSPFVVNHVKEKSIEGSNAKFTWGVKNGTELQRIVPGFSVQQEVSLVEGMKELMPDLSCDRKDSNRSEYLKQNNSFGETWPILTSRR